MSLAIHSTPRFKPMAHALQLVFIGSALLLNAQAPALAQESAAAAAASLDFQVPAGDLAAALAANKAARATVESGSPSFRREYVDWIDGAKAEATRQRRLLQTVEWLAEGKARNWEYAKC